MSIIFLMLWDWKHSVSWVVYGALVLTFVLCQVYGALYMSSGFFLPAICSNPGNKNCVALTFDDGPVLGGTDKLLSILKEFELEACFFCIGDRVEKNPALVKQLHDSGHIIGNHSYFHGWNFDLLSTKKMKEELVRTDNIIETLTGVRPKFFRPPYGVTNPNLAETIGNNYHVIGWSIRSFDTVIKDPKKLMHRITRRLKGGDIILFHDYSSPMLEILPDFIRYIESIGLKIVRLDKLIGERPYTLPK